MKLLITVHLNFEITHNASWDMSAKGAAFRDLNEGIMVSGRLAVVQACQLMSVAGSTNAL